MATSRKHLREADLEHRGWLGGSLLLLLLLVAGMGAPRNWWSPSLELSFRTYSAAGLRPGMAVMISGYPVGQVQRIRLLNDAQVQVTLQVAKAQQPMIGPRSRASLVQDGLISSPYVAITPDLHDLGRRNPGAPNETLIYEPSPGMASLIKDLAASRIPLQKVLSSSARLLEQRMPRSLDKLDRTLGSGERLANSLERDLTGRAGALEARVERATARVETTLSALQSTLGDIQALARSSNALLQSLSRSWLLQLLQPAPESPRPAPPAAGAGPGAGPSPR
ncbi:MAG: MCE family protein [Synechococcaceae bacterium WB9_2_112]|nr:MCE family protein [Synechococcaceae bacterium WB9_2_112]